MKKDTWRNHFSTHKKISLDFLPVNNPLSQALPYTVCTDTSWRTGDYETQLMGPLDTYMFIDNTCTQGSASVVIRLLRSASASIPLHLVRTAPCAIHETNLSSRWYRHRQPPPTCKCAFKCKCN